MDLLSPREVVALGEVAAALGRVSLGSRRRDEPAAAARHVAEAHVVPVELAAGDEEDAVRSVVEVGGRGR